MADRIDSSTGRDAFVEFGDRLTAWHQKGRTIPAGTVEVPQILEAACLGWTVEGTDVALLETGRRIDGWRALQRSDTGALFGVFPETYTPLQNRDAFEILKPLCEQGVAQFRTAGALREGVDVWALIEFNLTDPVVQEYFTANRVVTYGLLANNHNRTRNLVLMETPICVVCANTMGAALARVQNGKGRIKAGRYPGAIVLRHTANIRSATTEAVTDLWGTITERYAALARQYQALQATYLTVEEFERLVLDTIAPLPEPPKKGDAKAQMTFERVLARTSARRATVTRLWEGDGLGLQGNHSAYEAYQAAIEAIDHNVDDVFPTRGDRLAALYAGGSLADKKQDVLNELYTYSQEG